MKYLLPAAKRLELKEKSRYLTIDPELSDDQDSEDFELKLQRKYGSDLERHPDHYSSGFFSSDESEFQEGPPEMSFD